MRIALGLWSCWMSDSGLFGSDIASGRLEVRTPSFRELKFCGALELFGDKDLISSSCSEVSNVGIASCIQRINFVIGLSLKLHGPYKRNCLALLVTSLTS